MAPPNSHSAEEEWLWHKAEIRRLYLVERTALKDLVIQVGNLGLVATLVLSYFLLERQPNAQFIFQNGQA